MSKKEWKNEQEEERWWLRVRALKSFTVSARFEKPLDLALKR